jgi:hypothetical protein
MALVRIYATKEHIASIFGITGLLNLPQLVARICLTKDSEESILPVISTVEFIRYRGAAVN